MAILKDLEEVGLMSKKQQDDKTGLRPESHKVTRRKFLSHSGAGAAGLGMLGTGLGEYL